MFYHDEITETCFNNFDIFYNNAADIDFFILSNCHSLFTIIKIIRQQNKKV